MAFLTRSELINIGSSKSKSLNEKKAFNEATIKRQRRTKGLDEISVFISHKHDDSILLTSALYILSQLGVNLYLDWLDEEMPTETCGETANLLKTKIQSSDKFILLATDNAINSKWCNWELGFGDAKKYSDHISIFPIQNNDKTWTGNEYLQIYPSIEYWSVYDRFVVKHPGRKIDYLEEWLTKNE